MTSNLIEALDLSCQESPRNGQQAGKGTTRSQLHDAREKGGGARQLSHKGRKPHSS